MMSERFQGRRDGKPCDPANRTGRQGAGRAPAAGSRALGRKSDMTGRTVRPTWKLGRRTPPLRETPPGLLAPAAGLVALAAVIALGGLWAGALGSDEPDAK